MRATDHRLTTVDPLAQKIWDFVAQSPLRNLWDFQGASAALVWKRTFRAMLSDNLLSRAAEMGYYFLFALFPMLVTASSILGLAARQASHIYDSLLHYLALVLPGGAYSMVIQTFNQAAAASTSGKITIGLVAALWSASVGFASIQDGMNTVYKVRESRPYWKARGAAILVTMLLSVLVTANLAVLLGGDLVARLVYLSIWHHRLAVGTALAIHVVQWVVASACLMLQFSTIYYFAPDLKVKRWRWATPGAVIAIFGWVVCSLGLRIYLHFFNSFTITYGSLGGVIVLLTWFYITGLMLLLGAEVNSEIQAAVAEKKLKEIGALPPEVDAEPEIAMG
ncbi:MAG: YihY/virulence factor BrkB family protein [Acidobacteriaceae bacterium]